MLPKPNSCSGCVLYEHKREGFSRPDGTGRNGVMIIAEALGEQEEQAGIALVGKAGHYLFNSLNRVGINREDFWIFNTIACRPPNNKLAGMPYEQQAIDHCNPNLNAAITEGRERALKNGKTFVIVTLGKIAFKRIFGYHDKHPIMKEDYLVYPHWSDRYQAWVLGCDHPSYLMRGKHELLPILQFTFQRALEIAQNGLTLDRPEYLLDPTPQDFALWVDNYLETLVNDPHTPLSYDIETPMKQGESEEEVAKEVIQDDDQILRISGSYRRGKGASVPWNPEYLPSIARMLASAGPKVGWNSARFDSTKVKKQMPINGREIDAMLAWHVLNTSMPKALGFVTPFYVPGTGMWKHLSDSEPAFYNAKDADMALQCWLDIEEDLKKNNLWSVFETHVLKVDEVFAHMHREGVLLDREMRDEAEKVLSAELKRIKEGIEAAVPLEARSLKVYKKTPAILKNKSGDELTEAALTEGLIQVPGQRKAKQCPICNALDVKASHFKSVGKKRLKKGETENPCFGSTSSVVIVEDSLWAAPQEFKLSKKSLTAYQKVRKHRSIYNWKEQKTTFDEKAIIRLRKLYPNDPLYPLVDEHREYQGILSKYIGVTDPKTGLISGGLTVGEDGVIRTTFTHNPSTLRSAAQNPPLQQLPRPGKPGEPATIIRRMVVARPGHIFVARDYSGIEAVIVGYDAGLKDYTRLALRDVHSYYTAYALNQLDGRVKANDLPLLSWDDDKLFKRLAEIKKEFKHDRNSLYKHLVHAANFGQGAQGAREKILAETGIDYPVKLVQRVMDIYFELFPGIRTWQRQLLAQADRDGYLRNYFGYVHRFNRVYDWERVDGRWVPSQGPEANKVWAFKPQSGAAGIIKEAMLRIYFDHYDAAGRYLRLLVHDELFLETPENEVDAVEALLTAEMEKPIQAMPLPPAWGMGTHLVVNTEGKRGPRWGDMH